MFGRGDKDEIAFELDAFLAASRSCIDFISGMLALHIKGMNRRTSITSLLQMANKNPVAPFSGLLIKWQKWIEQLKEYRDECVHYQTIYMSGDFEIESRHGKKVTTVIPVLVPKEILPDKPTTRTGRNVMMLVDIHKCRNRRCSSSRQRSVIRCGEKSHRHSGGVQTGQVCPRGRFLWSMP